ncbi:MAG: hypothetical protein ISP91_00040 [Pseudomonadales bacterium]|jgi:hypothetical protein|nr:hypothetical protein [Pseudomonadales bacterium]
MHNAITPDLRRIKQEARRRRRALGNASYMQYLDLVSRELYGVRHFHEAQVLSTRVSSDRNQCPTQHYLRSLQEYYLDF